jgi:signal transduction histidine kinase
MVSATAKEFHPSRLDTANECPLRNRGDKEDERVRLRSEQSWWPRQESRFHRATSSKTANLPSDDVTPEMHAFHLGSAGVHESKPLLERLIRIAVEYTQADRGLLILIRHSAPRIEAEVTTRHGRIAVTNRTALVTPADLPQCALHTVILTKQTVLLDDASADPSYSKEEYVRQACSRSIVCVPIVKRTQLVGTLYLENSLMPRAFTPDRVFVLQLLASQAAISLENAGLYSDLQRSEAFLADGQRISQTGSIGWSVSSGELYWSEQTYSIMEYDRAATPTLDLIFQLTHPDDRAILQQALHEAVRETTDFDVVHRLLMPDGRVKHVHLTGRAVNTDTLYFVGAVRDVTERVRAEETLREAQDDLARVNRVTIMGELTASLAHELAQPISGTMTNADTCLRSLERDTLDFDAVRRAVTTIARDAQRAGAIIGRICSQFKKGTPNREVVDVNEINRETVALLSDEATRYRITVRTELAADLPTLVGDRVQLQQVAMNLLLNSIEAMRDVEGIRELVIKSRRGENGRILVSVSDTGIGFPPQLAEQIFEPFFTTNPQGIGIGLRISRSIIESHNGRLWAVGSPGRGATFHLSLPVTRKAPRSPADTRNQSRVNTAKLDGVEPEDGARC